MYEAFSCGMPKPSERPRQPQLQPSQTKPVCPKSLEVIIAARLPRGIELFYAVSPASSVLLLKRLQRHAHEDLYHSMLLVRAIRKVETSVQAILGIGEEIGDDFAYCRLLPEIS